MRANPYGEKTGLGQKPLVEVLAVYKSPDKIPVLVKLAAEKNRLNVDDQLEELGMPAARALMESFGETCQPECSGWVGDTLREIGDARLPVLVEGFRSDSRCKHDAAVYGLQRYYLRNCTDAGNHDPDPLVELFGYAAASDDSRTRRAALQWITSHRLRRESVSISPGVIEALIA